MIDMHIINLIINININVVHHIGDICGKKITKIVF